VQTENIANDAKTQVLSSTAKLLSRKRNESGTIAGTIIMQLPMALYTIGLQQPTLPDDLSFVFKQTGSPNFKIEEILRKNPKIL
jgi:hypothetical protein